MPLVSKNFSDIITFTRASTGTYFDSAGVLQSAAINAPRLDYNPSTLAAQGFLIEEARTNSIRNNTMQGAVAGTPGTLPTTWGFFTSLTGLTRTLAVGTENGISYIDVRLNGTPSAAGDYQIFPEAATQIAATSGQTWTQSSYYKLQAGSMTGISDFQISVVENNVSGTFLAGTFTTQPTPSASTVRGAVTRTLNNASTAFVMPGFRLVLTGAAIDITLRIGLPQLEQGAFATSVIPTTTTALTRSADVASVNTLSPWFNATAGTLFVQGIIAGGTAATFPYQAALVGANANTDSIGIPWSANTGTMRFVARVGAVAQADIGVGPSKTAGSSFKVAGRYAANDFQAAADGILGSADTSGTLPTITALSLGGPVSFQPGASVWLQRVTYYPRALSNAELQAITA